jgi:hypothetical protein
MANYSFIRVRFSPKSTKSRRIQEFEYILKQTVPKALDDRWQVQLASWEDGGPTWVVLLPGTAVTDVAEARQRLQAPGEDVGFPVTVQPTAIAFRHSMNFFTDWAQGRLAEQLSDHFQHGVFFDSTDAVRPPGTKEYRIGTTFREYLTRNFDKPLSKEDAMYVTRYMRLAPKGHW